MPGETVRDTAVASVEALKGSPGLLALVLLQAALLGVIAYTTHSNRAYDQQRFELLLKFCRPDAAASQPRAAAAAVAAGLPDPAASAPR